MQYNKSPRKRLGSILIEDGLITHEQLDQALEFQKTLTKPIGEVLVTQGFITTTQLTSALGRQLKIPYIPLLKYAHNPNAAKWVGKNFCLKYTLVPFDGDEKSFYVSVSNPLDKNPIETLQVLLNRRIFTFIATPDEIIQMIKLVYE